MEHNDRLVNRKAISYRWTALTLVLLLSYSSVSHGFYDATTPIVTPSSESMLIATAPSPYPIKPVLKGKLVVNEVQLEWSANKSPDFKHYSVIRTNIDNFPTYPDQPELFSANDRDITTYKETISLKEKSNYYYRVCSVNTKNNVSCSNIVEFLPSRRIISYDFFVDVERDSWYEPYVLRLLRKEVISSVGQTRFLPASPMTRGELARWVIKALIKRTGITSKSSTTTFCDVSSTNSNASYINTAYDFGIVSGENDGKCGKNPSFNPDRPVTRAEALKMILLAFDYSPDSSVISDDTKKYEDSDLFLDVHQDHWAAPYIGRAKAGGIISGYPDDTFRPNQAVNHAEMSKLVSLAFNFELNVEQQN